MRRLAAGVGAGGDSDVGELGREEGEEEDDEEESPKSSIGYGK